MYKNTYKKLTPLNVMIKKIEIEKMKLKEAVGKNFWLSEDELRDELGKLEGWKEEDGYIRKVYEFEDWKTITKFLKTITDLVVKLNHHPELQLSSKNRKAKVSLRSHNQNSITKYDIDFATKLDKKIK